MRNNNIFYAIYKLIRNEETGETINEEIQTTFDSLQEVSDYLQTPKSYIKSAITRKQIINNNYMIFKFRED